MHQIFSASSKAFRAFLLAGAILLGGALSPARADLALTATFTGVASPEQVTYSQNSGANWNTSTAGRYTWTGTGPAIAVIGSPFSTYCIEVGQNISNGQTVNYMLTGNVPALPRLTGGPMGVNKANQLGTLSNGLALGVLGFFTQAQMQTAVWHIVFEQTANDFNVNTGTFQVNESVSFRNGVNSLLSYVAANWASYDPMSSSTQGNVLGITNDSSQDQILFVNHDQYLHLVPAPAGVVLAGLGVAGLGGFSLLRRRKLKTT
jgi:hypothetical protein